MLKLGEIAKRVKSRNDIVCKILGGSEGWRSRFVLTRELRDGQISGHVGMRFSKTAMPA